MTFPETNEEGSLTLPFLLLLLLLASTGAGLTGLQSLWRKEVTRQLTLDRCVGSQALAFRKEMSALTSAAARMESERAVLMTAGILPAAAAAAKAALSAESALVDARLLAWKVRRAGAWGAGCPLLASHLPDLPWKRDPPDPLGHRPPRREDSLPARYRFSAFDSGRQSHAEISYDLPQSTGTARWVAPPSH